MDNFLVLAMKQEVMLDDDSLPNASQQYQSNDIHMGEAASVKEEEEENLMQPELLRVKEEADAEVPSSPCAAGSSGQEEGPEPRTEAQGAGQEDDGRSQRGIEPKFYCDVCQKAFSRKDNLFRHMRIHTGDKPFTCDTCGRSFCYKSELQKHILTHTGERPYVCETCGKGFMSQTHLNRHARVHTGEKPLKCDTCGKCFSLKHNLDGHIRIHTGEKPFNCETCGACFAQKSYLAGHVRVHTGKWPHVCECGIRFVKKASLRMHILKWHKHQQCKSATVSVKEEECLSRPELIVCTNNDDDAEELMEQQLVDPLSTAEMKIEKDIDCIEPMEQQLVDPLSTAEMKMETINCIKAEDTEEEVNSVIIPKTEAGQDIKTEDTEEEVNSVIIPKTEAGQDIKAEDTEEEVNSVIIPKTEAGQDIMGSREHVKGPRAMTPVPMVDMADTRRTTCSYED